MHEDRGLIPCRIPSVALGSTTERLVQEIGRATTEGRRNPFYRVKRGGNSRSLDKTDEGLIARDPRGEAFLGHPRTRSFEPHIHPEDLA